jgi:hypothetical protein
LILNNQNMKIEITKDIILEEGVNLKGSIFEVKNIKKSKTHYLEELYEVVLNNNELIYISSFDCSQIYEKETDPEKIKEQDDWFNNVAEEFIANPESEPIIKEITLKLIHDHTVKKSITFTLDGVDNITQDDVISQYEILSGFIDDSEEDLEYLGGESPRLNFSSSTISLSFTDESYSNERNKYWKLALKCFNLKEEKPKYEKLKSVLRYGICRIPDYNDMFFIEINAKKEIVEEFWNGDVSKLKTDLEKEGFKCNIINIDYIISDNEIYKTNSL